MNIGSTSSAITRRLGATAAFLLTLALAACATPAEPAQDSPAEEKTAASNDEQTSSESTQEGLATLKLSEDAFSFEIAFCSIDDTDIMIHGPGNSDASGEPAYLSIDFVREADFTTGDARVDLGATTQFESTDDIYVFTTEYQAGDYSLTADAESFVLEAEFRSGDGSAVGSGVLTVDCR